MSNPIKPGQKHISEKPAPKKLRASFSPMTLLDVPEWAKKDCEEKDQEYRWVDAKQMQENGNMHRNHWQVYRRDASTVPAGGDAFGLPPDGTVRRGTVVLAVRPKEIGDGHKAMLRQKAERMTSSVKKQGSDLRREIASSGARVIDETEIS
jgi:hypothetical protein